jgi:hypothetical protein
MMIPGLSFKGTDDQGYVEDKGENLSDFASGLAGKPVGGDFGLAVENEGSTNACKDLSDNDPCER